MPDNYYTTHNTENGQDVLTSASPPVFGSLGLMVLWSYNNIDQRTDPAQRKVKTDPHSGAQ